MRSAVGSAASEPWRRVADDTMTSGLAFLAGSTLVLATLVAYGLLVWQLEVAGPSAPGNLGLGLPSVLLLLGAAGFFGLGVVRGQFSLLWPGLVFPVAYALFHFGSLGHYGPGWYAPELVPLAWAMSAAALLAWMCGHALARGSRPFDTRHVALFRRRALSRADLHVLGWLGAALLVGGLVMQGVFLAQIGPKAFFDLEYMALKRTLGVGSGNPLIYVFGIGQLCTLAGLTVMTLATAIGRGRLFPGIVTTAMVGLYLLSLVLQGDRSQLGVVVFVCALVHHYFVRPIRWQRAVILFAVLVMTFSGVKMFRGTKVARDFFASAADTTMVEMVAEETGATLDTVVRAMDIVPSRYDYFGGSTYVHAAARAVPNVRFAQRRWGFVSSIWITRETAPERFARQGGIGFSVVAEAFINFGVLGAPLTLLAIGLLHGYGERWLAGRRVDVLGVCVFVILEVGLLLHVRNSTVLYVRNSLWMITLLVCALIPFFVRMRAKRDGRAR